MPKVKSFNDTSAVSLAYGISDLDRKADFATVKIPMKLLPYTTEGFSMQKEAKTSTAIRGTRRSSGSKNTKGSANGAVTFEFGSTDWIQDMLSLILLNDWAAIDAANPALGKYLVDGALKKYMVVEKTIKTGPLATDRLDHEWYFGTIMNDATLELGDGELITLACNTLSANADYGSAVAAANGLGGSIATVKTPPASYEIADSSNNLSKIEITNADKSVMEVTWSDASLQIQNNAREQSGLGSQFAAGIGVGKVAVTFSGTIYYFDQSILAAHMLNKRVSLKTSISTKEGTFTIRMPNLMAQAPTNNAESENTDFSTALTLVAEEGVLDVGTLLKNVPCVICVEFVPAPL